MEQQGNTSSNPAGRPTARRGATPTSKAPHPDGIHDRKNQHTAQTGKICQEREEPRPSNFKIAEQSKEDHHHGRSVEKEKN
jgi:hypothetical protein